MSFLLDIDAARWRAHLDSVASAVAEVDDCELVPVVKGQGYGLGGALLAAEAARLGAGCIAVGTVQEAPGIPESYAGDVLVLQPYDPRDAVAAAAWGHLDSSARAPRIVRTVSSARGLLDLAARDTPVRIVIEGLTSLRRFGLTEQAMSAALSQPDVEAAISGGRLLVEGLALHLPIAEPTPSRTAQVDAWAAHWSSLADVMSLTDAARTVWVSHLSVSELASVRSRVGNRLRPRIGTWLWHGDRPALRASGTVLAIHPLDDPVPVGYRQRSGPRGGTLVVVSGGTSHGVGLEAPSPAATSRQRMRAAGAGALEAAGRVRSPFTWAGRQRWFAEPPHMHVSLLWLPRGCPVPAVGDRIPAEVRFTISTFDEVRLA